MTLQYDPPDKQTAQFEEHVGKSVHNCTEDHVCPKLLED